MRILVGYQEDPALYTTLDTLHKDLVDAWIAGTPPGEREAAWQWTENDFEPVPFNSETLDLRGLLRDRLLEGARLQKTPDGPAFGPHPVEAPGMPSPPERVVN
ncbi:MAG: hypothetical protein GWO19_20065, partial [Nitrospinaceae bacterium]|nr:hypothetical protein [Nitrospinaceae bacterium]